jgi:hypothetical protein
MPPSKDVKRAGDRDPYEAMTQLVEAAHGVLSELPPELYDDDYGRHSREALAVVWPVLVVRGGLYQARLADTGDLRSERIDWQRVIWAGFSGQPTVLDVVRESHLEAYGRDARAGLEALESALRNQPAGR